MNNNLFLGFCIIKNDIYRFCVCLLSTGSTDRTQKQNAITFFKSRGHLLPPSSWYQGQNYTSSGQYFRRWHYQFPFCTPPSVVLRRSLIRYLSFALSSTRIPSVPGGCIMRRVAVCEVETSRHWQQQNIPMGSIRSSGFDLHSRAIAADSVFLTCRVVWNAVCSRATHTHTHTHARVSIRLRSPEAVWGRHGFVKYVPCFNAYERLDRQWIV